MRIWHRSPRAAASEDEEVGCSARACGPMTVGAAIYRGSYHYHVIVALRFFDILNAALICNYLSVYFIYSQPH